MPTKAEIESWKTDPDAAYAEAMRLSVYKALVAGALVIASVCAAKAGQERIVQSTETLCPAGKHADLLACVDDWYTDLLVETAPLSLDSGIHYPGLGGIFSTAQRHIRAEDGTEAAVEDLPRENYEKLVAAGDPANAYRVLSAFPTARNLFLSLDLLAQEVTPQDPTAAPLAYLFLTKITESTLHQAAVEDERTIYEAAERFRSCVTLTLIDRKIERLREICQQDLTKAASAAFETE